MGGQFLKSYNIKLLTEVGDGSYVMAVPLFNYIQGVPQLSSHFVSVILSASIHPNCKSWGSFEKFRKFAT